MKKYDAKKQQPCLLCGEEFIHNKQGRFTSHLIKMHSIDLNRYLIENFYSKEELKCSNFDCEKSVALTRGIPNKYCNNSCSNRISRKRECENCRTVFEKEDLRVKTCSKQCEIDLKSRKIKKWHKEMPLDIKEEHFKKIIQKTAKTRKKNGTPSWNSGKKNIYSKETLEKIRQATLKQLENQVFKKTNIEKIMEEFLIELKVDYKYSFILKKRQYDFVVYNINLLIECDGDYWHGNPKFYPNLTEKQKEKQKSDRLKEKIAVENGYKIIRFWEDDINNNLEEVKNKLRSILNDSLTTT